MASQGHPRLDGTSREPSAGPGIVIALAGFTRGPQHLQRLATACGDRGWHCLRPALAPPWLPVLYMHRRRLRRIARDLASQVAGHAVVVAGHSAGAAAGAYLAQCLRDQGVAVQGLVLIDGVDSPNHLIATSLPALLDLRIAAVLAPPSPCNRHSLLQRWLQDYPAVRVEVVDGAGHGDIEGAGVAVYRRMCQDASDAQTADRFLAAVLDAIAWAQAGPAIPREPRP